MNGWRSAGAVAGLLCLGAVSAVAGPSLTLLTGFWLGVALCALLLAGKVGVTPLLAYLSALSVVFAGTSPDVSVRLSSLVVPFVFASVSLVAAGMSLKSPPPAKRWSFGVLALGLLVAGFSGPAGGAGRMYVFLTEWLGVAPAAAESIVFYARKGMHLGLYALLAGVAFGFARLFVPRRAAVFALAWALVHATFDETRQAMSVGRTGAVWDVLLDMVGAVLALVLAAGVASKRERAAG